MTETEPVSEAAATGVIPARAPAGWYLDSGDAARRRWWDGTQWTDHVHPPAYRAPVPAAYTKAPVGTSAQTVWIWLAMLTPLLRFVPWVSLDLTSMRDLMNPSDSDALLAAEAAMFSQPAYWGAILVGLAITAATIVFAALDWRTLRKRGVPEPFPWAFAFFGVVSAFGVYTVGRAIVARRRTGDPTSVLVLVVAIGVQLAVMFVPIRNLMLTFA